MSMWTPEILEKFMAGREWDKFTPMVDSFEPRSIVLTLRELADKTPAGEPLLITKREWRAYADWQMTRAVKPTGGLPVFAFAGRELLLIDESRVVPQLEDSAKTIDRLNGAQARIFALAVELQRIRNPAANITESDRQDLKLTIDNTPINQLAQVEAGLRNLVEKFSAQDRVKLTPRPMVPMFSGEAELPRGGSYMGIDREIDEETDPIAAAIEEQKRRVEASIFTANREPIPRPRELTDDENRIRYMKAFQFALDTAAINAPPEARASESTFAAWVKQQTTEILGAKGNPSPQRGTECNIPVGVTRGYFEE